MNIYPYSSPIILTDVIYEEYGGNLDTALDVQRQAAYLISEMEASEYLETFLLPTTVTGTFQYDPRRYGVMLNYAYVNSINVVRFLDNKEYCYWAQTGTANVHVSLRNDGYGIMDIHTIVGNCACHNHGNPYPYQIQVMYTAGFPVGVATQPDFLLALVTYADIILNEIIGYGNEAPGDVGVQEFRAQMYSERRVGLLRTDFGTSPRAQFIKKLLQKYKLRRQVGL